MSHKAKPVVERSGEKTQSTAGAVGSSRSQKQPSEMLQRWKIESRKDMTFNERIYSAAQDQEKAKGKTLN